MGSPFGTRVVGTVTVAPPIRGFHALRLRKKSVQCDLRRVKHLHLLGVACKIEGLSMINALLITSELGMGWLLDR